MPEPKIRLSADENYRIYPKRAIDIYVDGELIPYCVEFDEVEGWVTHYVLSADETIVPDPHTGGPVIQTRYGRVESDMTAPERRMLNALRKRAARC